MSLVHKLSALIRIRFLRENPGATESDAKMFALGYITQFIDNNIGDGLENMLIHRIDSVTRSMNKNCV